MARRVLYHLHLDVTDETKELFVTEELPDTESLNLTPEVQVLATYSVDTDYDFGSIRIEDEILDMHEEGLSTSPGIVKIADFYYSKKDLTFSAPTKGVYDEFRP